MPGLKPMFRNSLSAEGAKAVTIKAWAPKARMLMPNSGRFVRLCVRLTILNLLKVYMNLYLRFLHFKFFKVLKQIMYLWIKWIMERCYPHLWWYFFFRWDGSNKWWPCGCNMFWPIWSPILASVFFEEWMGDTHPLMTDLIPYFGLCFWICLMARGMPPSDGAICQAPTQAQCFVHSHL